jgi:hypothetical protein
LTPDLSADKGRNQAPFPPPAKITPERKFFIDVAASLPVKAPLIHADGSMPCKVAAKE